MSSAAGWRGTLVLVIPTALILGLIVGRVWAVPAVALAWTGLLIVTGTLAAADIPSAAALGAANAAVGVLMHRGMLGLVRRAHHAQQPVPQRGA
jgi:hypothetical protein